MRALAAALCLMPGMAYAGLLDIFRRKEPEPEPEGFSIFGFDPASLLLIAVTVIAIGALLKYRPRFLMGVLHEMVGGFLAWVVAVLITFGFVFSYVAVLGDVAVVGALVVAAVIVFLVVIGSFFGS